MKSQAHQNTEKRPDSPWQENSRTADETNIEEGFNMSKSTSTAGAQKLQGGEQG